MTVNQVIKSPRDETSTLWLFGEKRREMSESNSEEQEGLTPPRRNRDVERRKKPPVETTVGKQHPHRIIRS